MAENESDHFSLRWNNFHSNLTTGFHDLLLGEDLVDVTLAAGGKFLQAHKIVLSVCSPYFKELFKVNPCKHPIVILKDVSYKDLSALLQFMYKGEVNVRQEELATFLKIAETLQIKGLTGDDDSSPSAVNEMSPRVVSSPHLMNHLQSQSSSARPKTFIKRPSIPPPSVSTRPNVQNTSNPSSPRSVKRNRIDMPSPPSNVPMQNKITPGFHDVVHTPKVEPDDYESDMDVLEGRNDSMMKLLGRENHTQRNSNDSHQSHYAGPVSHLDSSQHDGNQPHISHMQSLLDPIQPHLDSSQGSGIFSGISGITGIAQLDISQDGSQDIWRNINNTQGASTSGEDSKLFSSYACHFCNKAFKKICSFRSHVRNIHGDMRGPFPCPDCGKILKNMNSLKAHQHDNHRIQGNHASQQPPTSSHWRHDLSLFGGSLDSLPTSQPNNFDLKQPQ